MKTLNYNKVFLILFVCLMVLPLQNFTFDQEKFEKNFWGYNFLVSAFHNFRFFMLRDSIFDNAIVPTKNWMIYSGENSIDDFQRTALFSEEELANINARLEAYNAYLEQKGIKFLVVIPPNKNTIYPEYMPENLGVLKDRPSRLDQVLNYQRETRQTRILDLRPALEEARKDHQVYYAYDTHWNPLGAYVGYAEIMRALQVEPHPLTDFEIDYGAVAYSDLVRNTKLNLIEERISLVPQFRQNLEVQTYDEAKKPKTMLITNDQSDLPGLVVFHDSFFDELRLLVANHFRRSLLLATAGLQEDIIEEEGPDVVILEVTERYLNRILDPR